ncbi:MULTISPECIES: M20 aminoacylase family protein [unclassified Psychromonas]|uniref:M20 aminoacylase family protein n=1 Tax=unclassified Psychromonas TaxID=2614957 RepID=UPI0003F869ED|nr:MULTISPECIES: M20 aminoacylase family protein [unclassified Psychromonas]
MSVSKLLLENAVEWRKELHRYPELGFQEVKTSRRVAELLESFGISVDVGMAGTGVIGTLKNGEGPSIGLRADMDALPMNELGDVCHKSCNHGAMHACGHDGHTAILLATAKYLSENRHFKGTVYFIFQPAEENLGGARVMVEEGLFEKYPMSSVFGLHNWPGLPEGHVAVSDGAMMASLDTFKITLTGKSCHAAMPERGIDPIVCSSELVLALQSIVSRRLSPLDSAVVSVTQINGGEAINIVPETVVLEGTYRCLDTKVQEKVKMLIGEISSGVCATHGVELNMEFFDGYIATTNNEEQAKHVLDVAVNSFGESRVHWNLPSSMASEDFCFMLEKCPGAYFWLGADSEFPSKPLHNAYYDFNDNIIEVGIEMWCGLVEKLLK